MRMPIVFVCVLPKVVRHERILQRLGCEKGDLGMKQAANLWKEELGIEGSPLKNPQPKGNSCPY